MPVSLFPDPSSVEAFCSLLSTHAPLSLPRYRHPSAFSHHSLSFSRCRSLFPTTESLDGAAEPLEPAINLLLSLLLLPSLCPPPPAAPPVFSSRCTPVSSKREQRWRKTKQLGEGARNNFPSRFLFRPFIATNLTPSPPTHTHPPPIASCCYTIPNRGRNPFCRLPTMTPSDAGRSDRGFLLRFPRYRPVTNFFFPDLQIQATEGATQPEPFLLPFVSGQGVKKELFPLLSSNSK